jgi:hypothetical protein
MQYTYVFNTVNVLYHLFAQSAFQLELEKKNIGSCWLVIRHFFVIFFLAIFMNKSDDVQNDFLAVSNIRYLRMAKLFIQALSARDYLTIHRRLCI